MTDIFQPSWLREGKKTSNLYLFEHSALDACLVYAFTGNLWFFVFTVFTHYWIDWLFLHQKNRIPDRLCHLTVWILLAL